MKPYQETGLADCYEFSQADVAEKMFLSLNTIASTEKKAIEKFKKLLDERGIDIKDLL